MLLHYSILWCSVMCAVLYYTIQFCSIHYTNTKQYTIIYYIIYLSVMYHAFFYTILHCAISILCYQFWSLQYPIPSILSYPILSHPILSIDGHGNRSEQVLLHCQNHFIFLHHIWKHLMSSSLKVENCTITTMEWKAAYWFGWLLLNMAISAQHSKAHW